ncbi:hypothetical protein NECAME_16456, partial [Necator americanus]
MKMMTIQKALLVKQMSCLRRKRTTTNSSGVAPTSVRKDGCDYLKKQITDRNWMCTVNR